MEKETPDEKYEITNDREFDKVKDDYCPRCMFEDDITALRSSCKHAPHNQKHGLATPTEECPDCRCTDLVSDRCKGECVCHHPELPPTVEEWGEKEFRENLERIFKYSEMGYCPGCGLTQEGLDHLFSSHDAELRQKIEKFIDENDDGMWAGRETADAVLVLLGKENV